MSFEELDPERDARIDANPESLGLVLVEVGVGRAAPPLPILKFFNAPVPDLDPKRLFKVCFDAEGAGVVVVILGAGPGGGLILRFLRASLRSNCQF